MITIFLRIGAPTDWVFHRVLLDPESLTLTSVEGPVWGPTMKLPKVGWTLDQLNNWCLTRSKRHMRFAGAGYYQRCIRPSDVVRVAKRQKHSVIRQFWVRPDGTRLVTLHGAASDILDLPTPINLEPGSGIMRDGNPHFIPHLSVHEVPFNVLGELSKVQM